MTHNNCQLGLGSAQFGLNYGVTNTVGHLSEEEVAAILLTAHQNGIRWIDTAQSYGSAQRRLGKLFIKDHKFKVCSKQRSHEKDIITYTCPTRTQRLRANPT